MVSKKNKSVIYKYTPIILLIGCFMIMLPYIMKGIDVTDTCYLLTKYKYIFHKEVDVNSISTLYTEFIGGIIYHSFPEYQAFTLNFFNWLLILLYGIILYQLLKKYINKYILVFTIVGGCCLPMAAIHILHYNTISMVLQMVGLFYLFKAMEKDSLLLLFISGFIIGSNIFVRLPNVLQLSLGILIIWNGINHKYNLITIIKRCVLFAAGAFTAIILGVITGSFLLGWNTIKNNFKWISSMATSNNDAHSISTMGINFLGGIRNGFTYILHDIVFLILLLLIGFFINHLFARYHNKISKMVYSLCIILSIAYGYKIGNNSFIRMIEMLNVFTLLICIFGVVYLYKEDGRLSSLAIAAIITELIIPLGTSNGSYAYIYTLTFSTSISLCIIATIIRRYGNIRKDINILYIYLVFILSVLVFSGANFFMTNVYRDSDYSELICRVNIKEFKGIRTTKERADMLENLDELLNPFENETLLALGDFNIGYVITDMKPFFSKAWPDLASFDKSTFFSELTDKTSYDKYPVILLADIDLDGKYRDMEKYYRVLELAQSSKYNLYYKDDYYSIFIPVDIIGDN